MMVIQRNQFVMAYAQPVLFAHKRDVDAKSGCNPLNLYLRWKSFWVISRKWSPLWVWSCTWCILEAWDDMQSTTWDSTVLLWALNVTGSDAKTVVRVLPSIFSGPSLWFDQESLLWLSSMGTGRMLTSLFGLRQVDHGSSESTNYTLACLVFNFC